MPARSLFGQSYEPRHQTWPEAHVWVPQLEETVEEFAALSSVTRDERRRAAREKLLGAGAHAVVESVTDVPAFVEDLNRHIRAGERP